MTQDQISKKILIVEDDEDLRNLYIQILQENGYQIEAAVDGLDGYEKMQSTAFDLVLLDIMLPKMDGLTLLERFQKEENGYKNKKVILMTNLGQDNLIARALTLGVQGYLIKSDYTPQQLLKEVETALGE